MELLLLRDAFSSIDTLGAITIEGADFRADTVELPWLEGSNLPGQACIPPGRYEISIYASPHLGYDVLLLHDVPGRSMVEIHIANRAIELRGCIAPGLSRGEHCVVGSTTAFIRLRDEFVRPALDRGEKVFIAVTNKDDEDPSGSSARA